MSRPWSFVLGTQSVLGPWSGLGPESFVRAPGTEDFGRTQDIGRTKHEGPRTKGSSRLGETLTAFGQFTDVLHNLILYVIDNEIHHRGQGYVYLRALGLEPPQFYDRS